MSRRDDIPEIPRFVEWAVPKKTLWTKIRYFFGIYTVGESYQRGRDVVDYELNNAIHRPFCARRLWELSHGSFNQNLKDNAFDRGVRDRLRELNFDEVPFEHF